VALPFRTATADLAWAAVAILADGQPMTLRGLFYRMVSAGHLPSTDQEHYRALGRIMVALREADVIPWQWIVDGIRTTERLSSWSGLEDFADTVRDAYRKDFWASLPEYVHLIVEKDAMAGVIRPVSESYDVALTVVRGYTSTTLACEVAELWASIKKPVIAYYLGDFDPSGLDLERSIREKIAERLKRSHKSEPDRNWFGWHRLALTERDFADFRLLPLKAKPTDTRTKGFLARGHRQCAEIDALPAEEVRRRLAAAIESHIPQGEWERLRRVEELERKTWRKTLQQMRVSA
jgi:hypothetical protein